MKKTAVLTAAIATIVLLMSCNPSQSITVERPPHTRDKSVSVSLRQTGQETILEISPSLIELNADENVRWTFQAVGIPTDDVTFDVRAKQGGKALPGPATPKTPTVIHLGPFKHGGGTKPEDGEYSVAFTFGGQTIVVDPGYRIYP